MRMEFLNDNQFHLWTFYQVQDPRTTEEQIHASDLQSQAEARQRSANQQDTLQSESHPALSSKQTPRDILKIDDRVTSPAEITLKGEAYVLLKNYYESNTLYNAYLGVSYV